MQCTNRRQDWINELLHRITVAETREVRMALCAEIKRDLQEKDHENANEARSDLAVLPRVAEPGAHSADL